MKFLKKNTIKALFLFARSAEEKQQQDETLPGVLFDGPHENNPYMEFLEGLTQGELAELTALYLLGTEKIRNQGEWESRVQELTQKPSDILFQANPQRIPQIIRLGLERLARFRKSPVPRAPQMPTAEKKGAKDALLKIAGQFTLDSYLEKYGELDGMKRLLTILEIKGYLNDQAIRSELGLPPIASRMPLETLHIEKK